MPPLTPRRRLFALLPVAPLAALAPAHGAPATDRRVDPLIVAKGEEVLAKTKQAVAEKDLALLTRLDTLIVEQRTTNDLLKRLLSNSRAG